MISFCVKSILAMCQADILHLWKLWQNKQTREILCKTQEFLITGILYFEVSGLLFLTLFLG